MFPDSAEGRAQPPPLPPPLGRRSGTAVRAREIETREPREIDRDRGERDRDRRGERIRLTHIGCVGSV